MLHRFSLVEFSVNRPWLVLAIVLLVTIGFGTRFAGIRFDTNPKNMLPPESPVRVLNAEVEKAFGLYEDMLVVGVVNDAGVFNAATLQRIERITSAVSALKGVASRDVTGFTTITNVSAEAGTLKVAPLMQTAPETEAGAASLRKAVQANPLFLERLISRDGKATAIYIPLEKGANAKEIADEIREITGREKGAERYYVAGDPVARDTFGAEMFTLMGKFAPIAGAIMFGAILVMFRSMSLAVGMMAVAMVSILWSMGLFIGLGYPVHIMSSMAPVFLMAIATDSIHIFNEFRFRLRESKDKRTAIIETMHAVSAPVRYTALATAVGFAVLLFMSIIPVRVFGAMIAFGTVVLRLLSFSVIPAILMLMKDDKARFAHEPGASGFLRSMCAIGARRPRTIAAIGGALIVLSAIGVSRLNVNNNMVEWFKKASDIRVADAVMNSKLGGTSVGYVVAAAQDAEYMKTPEAMRYVDGLQRQLEALPIVGKTSSVVDYVRRINVVLHDDNPAYDVVPDSKEIIGQYLFLFGMSARPSDMDSVIDYDFKRANITVQLKTWDASAMREIITVVEAYQKANPGRITLKPAGSAYFNLVWNDEVLMDMLKGFVIALVAVFAILAVAFRSFKWALVAYAPLLLTVLVIYGVVGFAGKDFDMPISVLSCLSLGMAVDFSIHFIGRFRQRLSEGDPDTGVKDALLWTASRPGKGIVRNAVLFAAAFSVMIFAPLTPYITVGAFIVSMMFLSAALTLILLPALVMLLKDWLFERRQI
ncbi:MAG: MMPL family transporter [Deltaproteobacteria bacterium]|nr:MMPL family transporter [Deltaproteobacteria bacterium]